MLLQLLQWSALHTRNRHTVATSKRQSDLHQCIARNRLIATATGIATDIATDTNIGIRIGTSIRIGTRTLIGIDISDDRLHKEQSIATRPQQVTRKPKGGRTGANGTAGKREMKRGQKMREK